MRILLVGAGGVGGAFTAIAARRDFFETIVVADYDPTRAEKAAATDERYVAAQVDASNAGSVTALCQEHGITHVMNAVDPVFNMPIFEGAFAAGADYLDMAMSLSKPHPEAPYEKTGVKLGDEQFAVAERLGAGRPARAGRDRRRARTVRRLRAVRRRPPLLRDRRARHPRRRQPGRDRRRRQRDLRAVVLDVDHDRGVPQPAGDLAGRRLAHDGAVQRAGGLRLPRGHRPGRVRERGARGGAPHAALGRLQAGDVQVRPRRRVHQHPQGAQHARPRPHREGARQGCRGQPRATWSQQCCPTRPPSARG